MEFSPIGIQLKLPNMKTLKQSGILKALIEIQPHSIFMNSENLINLSKLSMKFFNKFLVPY